MPEKEVQRYFMLLENNQEIHFTACAVSRKPSMDAINLFNDYKNLLVEPNDVWGRINYPELHSLSHFHKDQLDPERAYVKIYQPIEFCSSVISENTHKIEIPMPFFGENAKECWGELQLHLKFARWRKGIRKPLRPIKMARHRSYDKDADQWVEETKIFKFTNIKNDHCYLPLRFYHQGYLPEKPPDWHWEPLYIAVGNNFYRFDVVWENETIAIMAVLLAPERHDEIPEHLIIPDFLVTQDGD